MADKILTLEEVNQLIDKYNENSDKFDGDWEKSFFEMLEIHESNSKRVGKIMNVLFDNLDDLPKPVIEVLQKYSNLERDNLKGK